MRLTRILIFTPLTFFLFLSVQLPAMPPHPGNTNPSGRERPAPVEASAEPLYKSLSRSPAAMRSSPIASGTVKVLVILVDFPNMQMDDLSNSAFFKELLENSDNPGALSMTKYYKDMSNENLTLTLDVFGPYTASNNYEYYGENDSNDYDKYPATLVGEAIDLANPYVNYSEYTTVGGYLPTVIIIHAGQGEEWLGAEDTIWSHNWNLNDAKNSGDGTGERNYDGVKINNYTIQPEYNRDPGDATIGVFCHEFGHVLGLPDLYDISGKTNGVGAWSLMASGSWGSGDGEDPAPLLAWERYFAGGSDWITITTLSTDVSGQEINDIKTTNTAYRIPLGSSGQYLLLEGKKRIVDTSGWVVHETGILITQINENIINRYLGTNNVNTGYDYVHGVNVIEAKSNYYDDAGRGTLWRKSDPTYGTMTFSLETRNFIAPSSSRLSETLTAFPVSPPERMTSILIFSLLISLIFFILKTVGKSLFRLSLAFIPFLLIISSCPNESSGVSYPLVSHPNTNYYKSEDIYSKVGNSGVTISNISSKDSFPITFDLDMP